MYKVGILYVCTGKYATFWHDFYEQTEKLFLPECQKNYYVFTDDETILNCVTEGIHPIFQEVERWPFPTLNRFKYFNSISEDIKENDYLFFMNANLMVNKSVSIENILPKDKEKLVVTMHPGFFSSKPSEYTYDRNPKCTAFIPQGEGKYYFAGGLNGGVTEDYLAMIRQLAHNTDEDLENDIIAIWHDESHLNNYMWKYCGEYKILSPAYLYPEGWDLPFEEIITVRDKNRFGGHSHLRN